MCPGKKESYKKILFQECINGIGTDQRKCNNINFIMAHSRDFHWSDVLSVDEIKSAMKQLFNDNGSLKGDKHNRYSNNIHVLRLLLEMDSIQSSKASKCGIKIKGLIPQQFKRAHIVALFKMGECVDSLMYILMSMHEMRDNNNKDKN